MLSWSCFRTGRFVVLFNNANTHSNDSNNQILSVMSADGGKTWSRPSLVGADIVSGEPQCNTGDGSGAEACIPGPFIRVDDDPKAATDPVNGDIYAVWNDYSFGRYAIRMSISTDGGVSWKEQSKPVNGGSGDTYMASVGVSPINHDIAVGFYSSVRVPNENTFKGLFKPGSGGVQEERTRFYLATSKPGVGSFSISPVSPFFGAPNGQQAGFNGDYSGMVVVGKVAHPIWSDTRNVFKTSTGAYDDEDIFTTTRTLSGGHATTARGG